MKLAIMAAAVSALTVLVQPAVLYAQTGACCFPDEPGHPCFDSWTEWQCVVQGGAYHGDGTVCGPVAACCYFDGGCDTLAQDCCFGMGGEPAPHPACLGDPGGNGVDDACEEIPTGACCFEDVEGHICYDGWSQWDCIWQGGAYHGDGSVCGPVAACCYFDGGCDTLAQDCCYGMGGEPAPHPTCLGDPGGNGVDDACEEIPTGACCFEDAGGHICYDGWSQWDCIWQGGAYHGDGTVCGPVSACCFFDGGCDTLAEDCCDGMGGVPSPIPACLGDPGGNGIDDACELVPTGACCFPGEPGHPCFDDWPQWQCEMQGGAYHGDGTMCGPVAACCYFDGGCDTLAMDCCFGMGGEPNLDEPICLGDPGGNGVDDACEETPTGACCFSEEPGHPCFDGWTEWECASQGGDYHGDWTVCGPIISCCQFDGYVCEPLATDCCPGMGGWAVDQCMGDLNGNVYDDGCEEDRVACEPQGGGNPVHPPAYWYDVAVLTGGPICDFHVELLDGNAGHYAASDAPPGWNFMVHAGEGGTWWASWWSEGCANPVWNARFRFQHAGSAGWARWRTTFSGDGDPDTSAVKDRSENHSGDPDGSGCLVHVPLPLSACPPDLDGNGVVDAADLAQLLGAWGPNPGHPADFNGDDLVNAADLAQLLGSWGPCE